MSPQIKEPLPLRWIRAHGLTRLTPWYFVDSENERDDLRREYRAEVSGTERDIYPFARRQDRDELVGFVVEDGVVMDVVLQVHLTWKRGPEVGGFPRASRFANLWEWLKAAIDDIAEWCSEEDLEDISAPWSKRGHEH